MEFVNSYEFLLLTIGLIGLSIGWDSQGAKISPFWLLNIRAFIATIAAFLFTIEGIPFITSAVLLALTIVLGKYGYLFTQAQLMWVRPQVVWSVLLPVLLNIAALVAAILTFAF